MFSEHWVGTRKVVALVASQPAGGPASSILIPHVLCGTVGDLGGLFNYQSFCIEVYESIMGTPQFFFFDSECSSCHLLQLPNNDNPTASRQMLLEMLLIIFYLERSDG